MRIKKIIKPVAFVMLPAILWIACAENSARTKVMPPEKELAQPGTTIIPDTIAKPLKPYAQLKYSLVKPKQWIKAHEGEDEKIDIAAAINRTDATHLARMDSILIPNDFSFELKFYLPFPIKVPAIEPIKKIVLFSYPAQVFAAYSNGELVRTGPVNMGRKNRPTPTGLYFTNWKAEHTVSTVNDEWDLYWNFNIENRKGIGWHQYSLPGYPASHSCLRLRAEDARYLYSWADQWNLIDNETIQSKGTPVVVFGRYDFDSSKPWLAMADDPKTLEITAGNVKDIVAPYLEEIMHAQGKRDTLQMSEN